jgi:uroporphyrinogen-III decarboxylase
MDFQLDLEAFWAENAVCSAAYTTAKPRLKFSFAVGEDIIKSTVGITDHSRFYLDFDYQQQVRAEASIIWEKEVGVTIGPAINVGSVTYASLFGGKVVYPDNAPPWIEPVIESKEDILATVRRMEDAELTELGIMPRWLEWRQRILERYGVHLGHGSGFHGPATMSAMLCGTTRFLYFIQDYPDLMKTLYETIAEVGVRFMSKMRELTGLQGAGAALYDDDSALLSPGLFAEYEFPVLARWYKEFAPEARDRRYFHSDGDMSHHLERLNALGITNVNLGPAVDLEQIREQMPDTVIHGHWPPLLWRNGTPEEVIERIKGDFSKVGRDGGMVVAPAGSINEGTPFENIRAAMFAVQTYCRLDQDDG